MFVVWVCADYNKSVEKNGHHKKFTGLICGVHQCAIAKAEHEPCTLSDECVALKGHFVVVLLYGRTV